MKNEEQLKQDVLDSKQRLDVLRVQTGVELNEAKSYVQKSERLLDEWQKAKLASVINSGIILDRIDHALSSIQEFDFEFDVNALKTGLETRIKNNDMNFRNAHHDRIYKTFLDLINN